MSDPYDWSGTNGWDGAPVDMPEPCTEEARAEGCTCGFTTVHATDIDPPEPKAKRS